MSTNYSIWDKFMSVPEMLWKHHYITVFIYILCIVAVKLQRNKGSVTLNTIHTVVLLKKQRSLVNSFHGKQIMNAFSDMHFIQKDHKVRKS